MKSRIALKEFLDTNLGIVIIFDDDGRIMYLNMTAKDELGYDEDVLNEFSIGDIFSDFSAKQMSDFISSNEIMDFNTSVYRKNHTCFPATVRLGRINLEGYFNVASIINLYNEHEAKKVLEKTEIDVKEVMRARNEFVANITHELRTPVNGIKGHVKNLLSKTSKQEDRKTLEIIENCCTNMENIINDLLDFSKIEAGRLTLEERPFDIRNCINHVIDTSMTIVNEKGIKLTAMVAEDVPQTVIGDELRVIQILNNLVSNAIKFTSIGYVRIEVYKTLQLNNEVELSFLVIDTGIGIGPEGKDKLFKSFSQVDASTTRQYGGTGLGLAICKQLVELMRGNIGVESEKGKGSTFMFSVMLATDGEVQEDSLYEQRKILTPEVETIENIYVFGSRENREEIRKNLEKLIICIELGTWDKAELFAGNVKELFAGADKEIRSRILKLQMAIRKGDYDNSNELYEEITEIY